MPSDGAGVPYAATQLLLGFSEVGATVDCFAAGNPEDIPARLFEVDGMRIHAVRPRWREAAWYNRNSVVSSTTGQFSRAAAQVNLVGQLIASHARERYDALYLFSQIESVFAWGRLDRLPPIVVHPEVHAAGELRWHKREAELARRCESRATLGLVRAVLAARAAIQRHDAAKAVLVVSPSARFAELLGHDYGIPRGRIAVVPNPIDLQRFAQSRSELAHPLRLLFVSRLSVRKGLELVIGLSRALDDLKGRVMIEVVGDRTKWSDYRCLLRDLNPAVAVYRGPVRPEDTPSLYAGAAALLQPSHYEPFALTVGEALASGVPIVASTEVGACEGLPRACCRVFPAGNLIAFEEEVRSLVAEIENGRSREAAHAARDAAEAHFSRVTVARMLVDAVHKAVAT